jgi:hypothetical protein
MSSYSLLYFHPCLSHVLLNYLHVCISKNLYRDSFSIPWYLSLQVLPSFHETFDSILLIRTHLFTNKA